MRARIFINEMRSGAAARDYLRLVKGGLVRPMQEAKEPSRCEAQDILESIRNQTQPYEPDIDIEGQTLLKQMDSDLEDFGVVPYWYSEAAKSRGEGIYPGVSVIIAADPLRVEYRTIEVSFSHRAIRVTDGEHEYVLPWDMVVPAEGNEKDRPYWFTALARDRAEDLQVGDYVRVEGLEDKYELTGIFWQFGEVEVRVVGTDRHLGMPWKYVSPWREDR